MIGPVSESRCAAAVHCTDVRRKTWHRQRLVEPIVSDHGRSEHVQLLLLLCMRVRSLHRSSAP